MVNMIVTFYPLNYQFAVFSIKNFIVCLMYYYNLFDILIYRKNMTLTFDTFEEEAFN